MAFVPAFGRKEDQASVEKVFGAMEHPTVSTAVSWISGVDDNADVDLCKIYEKVTGQPWNSMNQNPRGFCVGFGNAKMATLALSGAASAGELTFPGNVAVEPVYGGMRYEIGYKEMNSDLAFGDDGGVGAWAVRWFEKYGVLLMKPYGNIDFTEYSMERCDRYGSKGVPDELEPIAKEHPFKNIALCNTADDVWRMNGQIHPVVHCSNQGFSMSRDSNGICRPSGSWAHCAGWSGRFTLKNGRRVIRYDNSWEGRPDGNGYLGRPVVIEGQNGPIFLNGNQFLVELETVDSMCRRGRETYSISGPAGFTKRRPLGMV